MEPLIGQITLFGGNFAPRGWALCEGQLLPISSYSAVFSIFGTTYGGDGRTTFALPDLRGRVPIQQGTGPGLSPHPLGSKGGVESVTLTTQQIPAHHHAVNCTEERGTTNSPISNYPAGDTDTPYLDSTDGVMNANVIGDTGGGQAHTNIQPFLAINYIVALEGVFPSRK